MKQCRKCSQMKPVESFHTQANAADKKDPYCKMCRAGVSSEYYQQNKAAKAAYNRSLYWNNKLTKYGWDEEDIQPLVRAIRMFDLHRQEIIIWVDQIRKGETRL